MPFLRAALIPNKQPEKPRKKPKMEIHSVQDLAIALAVKAWIYADDRATKREMAELGLNP